MNPPVILIFRGKHAYDRDYANSNFQADISEVLVKLSATQGVASRPFTPFNLFRTQVCRTVLYVLFALVKICTYSEGVAPFVARVHFSGASGTRHDEGPAPTDA
jgi:hypothetical protein